MRKHIVNRTPRQAGRAQGAPYSFVKNGNIAKKRTGIVKQEGEVLPIGSPVSLSRMHGTGGSSSYTSYIDTPSEISMQ